MILLKGQTCSPYSKIGRHFVLISSKIRVRWFDAESVDWRYDDGHGLGWVGFSDIVMG